MSLRFAYNTNGTASHRLGDALDLMAAAGYDGVALTLDYNHFDPFDEDWQGRARALRRRLDALRFGCVIETGARFLLDPQHKHEPTFVTASAEGRARRVAFLKRATEVGVLLDAEAVSFWAGVPKPGVDRRDAAGWLHDGVAEVAGFARTQGLVPALEPEPGMMVETVDDWASLARDIPGLTLALDLGHLLVTGEREPPDAIREFAGRIGTVSIEDMRRGDHTHLPFGEGDMDVPACLAALDGTAFTGLVCVELSRDSHRADTMIRTAREKLAACARQGGARP